MRYLFYLLLLVGLPLSAQVAAPDFLCTRSEMGAETLTWANNPSTCGPFQATEIFSATTADGPFSLLAEVTDPTATTFQDPNPTGELRYYFLRHRHDCPGQESLNSDTLDNRIPETPSLTFVGLEDDNIVVEWLASGSPEVVGYVVFERFTAGIVALDTVFDGLRFELPVQPGDPPLEERTFLLVAIDACGNESPQGRSVGAQGLAGTGGVGCTDVVTLEVDQAAVGSFLPVALLELFVSVNGAPFTATGTFAPTAATVTYAGANDGEDLCFYVEAVLAGDRGRARSAVFCQSISFNQPVRDFPLFGVEVNQAGELILQYAAGGPQPVPTGASLRVTRGNGVTETADLPGFSFADGTLVIPAPVNPLQPTDEIRLRVVDDCLREVTTNAVTPVFLSGMTSFPGRNILSWTPFVNNLPGTFTYSVARALVADPGAVAGAMFEQIAVDTDDVSLTDNTGGTDGIACYQVSVRFFPEGQGPTASAIFRSNIVCILPRTEVFVPNAFSPTANQAENVVFRPRFSSPPPAEGYSLRVYDRWGGLLFETADPAAGWPGDAGGQSLPAGTFLYQLAYRTPQGDEVTKAGTVNLIR